MFMLLIFGVNVMDLCRRYWQLDEIGEAHWSLIEGIGGIVNNGMQRVLRVPIEASELLIDSCGSGHGGLWDLLTG
jgi:hypothetical protein